MVARELGDNVVSMAGSAWVHSERPWTRPRPAVPGWRLVVRVLLPAGLVIPSLLWIVTDRSVWSFDQSWYGEESVALFDALVHDPATWPALMISVFGIKAPGIAWLGQLFVPIGLALGSVEIGLLLSVLLVQAATLCISFAAFLHLTNGQRAAAIVGAASIAAAPLFVAMSHQYFVEPLQTLAVAWFIAIMAYSRRWRRPTLIAHLIAATAVAMVSKASSPIYCFAPGVVAIASVAMVARPRGSAQPRKPVRAASTGGVVVAALFAAAVASWYVHNWVSLTSFIRETSSGSVASLFGVQAAFDIKARYWLVAAQQSFGMPLVVWGTMLLGIAAAFSAINQARSRRISIPLDAVPPLVALVQVLTVVAIFSLQVNDEQRYLMPLVPYVGLLVASIVARFNRLIITGLFLAMLCLQLLLVYNKAFGVGPDTGWFSYWLVPPMTDIENRIDVDLAVKTTCQSGDRGRYTVVGVELPWFNANSLSFFEEQRVLSGNDHCYYTSLGFGEDNPVRAWDRIMSLNAEYFVTVDPSSVPIVVDSFNRVSLATLQHMQGSDMFESVPVANHGRVLVYKRAM